MLALRLCVSVLARPQPVLQPYLCQLVGALPALLWPVVQRLRAFRRIQALVKGRALPPWYHAATSSLLRGVADVLEAMR